MLNEWSNEILEYSETSVKDQPIDHKNLFPSLILQYFFFPSIIQ